MSNFPFYPDELLKKKKSEQSGSFVPEYQMALQNIIDHFIESQYHWGKIYQECIIILKDTNTPDSLKADVIQFLANRNENN